MCGIFGIYSSGISRSEEGLFNVLVHGLKRLEYRGYDSAGACVSMPEQGDDSCEPTIVKTVGKVQALSALLDHMKRSGQFKILPKIIPGKSCLEKDEDSAQGFVARVAKILGHVVFVGHLHGS